MESVPTPAVLALFAAGALVVWVAGLSLSSATDALDDRLGFGEALGGMVLLAIAGSLPEIAITVSASVNRNMDLAVGNLIGGIAVQTLVLVVCDIAVRGDRPLSYLVGSLIPVVEALLVIVLVSIALMGALLPESVAVGGVSPASLVIVVVWVGGIALLNRMRKQPSWRVEARGSDPGRLHRRQPLPDEPRPFAKSRTVVVVGVFVLASLVTLAGGVLLEVTGDALADRFGINGIIFGATVLALVSALPEISTGIAAVRLGDNQLAMGDILGGNAFQVCLFLLADLLAGSPVLPDTGAQNGWLGVGGILLTGIYAGSIVLRPERRWLRMGPDSLLCLVVYGLIVLGLTRLT